MDTAWSKPTKYIVAVGIVIFGIYILYLGRSVIPLLILAALIAVIVRPVILWLHHRLRLPRGVAVALVYLLVLILAPLAVALAVPAIVDAVRYVFSLDYPLILRDINTRLIGSLASIKAIQIAIQPIDDYVDQAVDAIVTVLQGTNLPDAPNLPSASTIIQSLSSALSTTFGAAASLIGAVFSNAILIIFIFLASIYISLSAHSYRDAFLRLAPPAYQPEFAELLRRIERTWNAFFRGQITLMFLIGMISWLGLTILGVPGAVSLAIIAGLLELIPNLGPIIATIPAVIVALLQGSDLLPWSNLTITLLVLGFYILVQQLENSVIVPRVLGEAVELPPLVVMTGVLVGGTVGGILGALLATPFIATGREILRYIYRKLQGEQPFPPEEQAKPSAHQPRIPLHELILRRIRPGAGTILVQPIDADTQSAKALPEANGLPAVEKPLTAKDGSGVGEPGAEVFPPKQRKIP